MAVLLSRLDPAVLREALADSGHGGWLAAAGGGWTLVAAQPALGEPADDAAYALAATVRDRDPKQAGVLLWRAEPDSGYLLQRGRDADSHVWGVADDAAARGDARAAARLLGDVGLEVAWRAALRRTGSESARAEGLSDLVGIVGADPHLVTAAAAGVAPAEAEPVPAPPPCRARPAAAGRPGAGAVATPAGWSQRGLIALAVVFVVVVVADAVRLGTGTGADFGGVLAIILFAVLAVICLAVSLGLRRSMR